MCIKTRDKPTLLLNIWIENLLFTSWTQIRFELSNILMQTVCNRFYLQHRAVHLILISKHLPPVFLCLRKLLRHSSTCSHQCREPPHHIPGTPQPAQKLPHTQQIAQQPGEGCRGGREQWGGLRPVRQVLLNLVHMTACVGKVMKSEISEGKTKM